MCQYLIQNDQKQLYQYFVILSIISKVLFYSQKMLSQLWQKAITKASSDSNKENRGTNMLLPNQLGGKILDKEIECENQTVSQETVAQLMELYTNAIEYYESIGCKKYQYFQRRIQNLLVKPLVQSILQGKSSTLSFKREEIERRQRQASVNSKEEAIVIIQSSQKTASAKTKQLHNLIKDQENILLNRIQRRKSTRTRSSRSEIDGFSDMKIQKMKIQNLSKEQIFVFQDIKNKPNKKVFF